MTDDFDQKNNAADVDDGAFNEFDQAPQGGSLADIWHNNPILKILAIVLGLVVVIVVLVRFGGSKEDVISTVGTAVQDKEAPGNEVSEAYRTAIEDVNQQNLEKALQTGESAIPIPVSSPPVPEVKPEGEPPVAIEDPLAEWRTAAEQPVVPSVEPMSGQPIGAAPVQQAALGPTPEAVAAMSQAMSAQMQAILAKHQIKGAQIAEITPANYIEEKEKAARAAEAEVLAESAAPVAETVEEILVPAGTIVYAKTLTEANSDVPGPVLARIESGPLAGTRILGAFEKSEEYLTLNFDQVIVKGVSQNVDAVAVDPKTTLPGVATEVDHRYWKRVFLPAAAKFIEGMGSAIASREQTTVSVNGSTVTSSKPKLNTRQEIAAGFEEGTSKVSDELEDIGDATETLVRVEAGTPIGILFLEPVIKPKS